MIDLSQGMDSIKSRLEALKTFKDSSTAEKDLLKSAGNSASEATSAVANQLNEVQNQTKRFQRDTQTSLDKLTSLLTSTRGNGNSTFLYLRKKMIQAYQKMEPKAIEILSEEAIKVLGCSQEQTYKGVSSQNYDIKNLSVSVGLYLPATSFDIFGNLKNGQDSIIGKTYYEKDVPSGDIKYIPFGGKKTFPMNRALNLLTDSSNSGRGLSDVLGKVYNGKSGQPLFDVQYVKNDQFGISGDYFRVIMLNRTNTPVDGSGEPLNKVGQFLKDYYSTIRVLDSVDVTMQVVNLLTNAVSIKAKLGYGQYNENNKFALIVQRILGLCFDDRREIDVSGVSKVPELDGVDDSFFELNEIDLRFIDSQISDAQNGIIEFEGCDGIKLPVDSELLMEQLLDFRENSSESIEENTKKIERIFDSVFQNPQWQFINSVNLELQINKNILKLIPQAVAASILTPKNLLPILALLGVLQQQNVQLINQGISIAGQLSITTPTEFLKKFKEFSIQVISKINNEFLNVLFELLKKDIINLLSSIIKDISKSAVTKKYTIYLRLIQLALIIIPAISDYRKCKSLLDDILQLLNLISNIAGGSGVPSSLLVLAGALPGTSPERAAINVFEKAQKIGLPTGPLPDGSPNLMNQFVMSMIKGVEQEENENGKVLTTLLLPPQLGGGLLQTVGKKF